MDLMATLIDNGMLLQSLAGALPNVAELSRRRSRELVGTSRESRHLRHAGDFTDSPDVVRTRLVNGR
jgi:hypothetical protein